MVLHEIVSKLKEAGSIAVMPHINADGDGLGSSLALALALKQLDRKVTVYLEEDVPRVYSFLPGQDMVELYKAGIKHADVAVALDTGDLERLGKRVDIFNDAKITVNIDHHKTNTEFAFYNYVGTSSSAVGEIVYQLIKMMGLDVDTHIASCLYVAIATDTGGFRFSNTTAVTHQTAADLINKGVNVADISQRIFDTVSLEKVRLMGQAVNSLELMENGRIAIITITDDMIKATGAAEEDYDGIVNIGRNINGVEVAVMLRERNSGEIKANLRSKSYVDVSAIAGLYSGGGHKRAAGFTFEGKLEDLKGKIIKDIKGEL